MTHLEEIANLCRDLIYSTRLDNPHVLRLASHLWHQLGEGQPVSPQMVESLIAKLRIPSDLAKFVITQRTERDRHGNILGLFGLSLVPHPHQYHINGRTLFTWCAIDALLFPILLEQAAKVESVCPVTKEKIQLRITPAQVDWVTPATTMVSMVLPEFVNRDLESVDEIRGGFCQHVRFFASPQAVTQWASQREQTLTALTIKEAEELVRRALQGVGQKT